MIEGLAVGRIVHVKLGGNCRPAIIVQVWADDKINAVCFVDGSNDGLPPGQHTKWFTSLHYSDNHDELNSFHWPERVP